MENNKKIKELIISLILRLLVTLTGIILFVVLGYIIIGLSTYGYTKSVKDLTEYEYVNLIAFVIMHIVINGQVILTAITTINHYLKRDS